MVSRYLDLEDILAEEERVPCAFSTHVYHLGHLDASSGSRDIEKGQVIELPLWLAEGVGIRNLAHVMLPRNYSSSVRASLAAAPENVRLREKSPHYYSAGLRLAVISRAEDADKLPAAIKSTLATRVHNILLRAANSVSVSMDVSGHTATLTDLERRLFWLAYAHTKDKLEWRRRVTSFIRPLGQSIHAVSSHDDGIAKRRKRARMAAS